MIPSLHVIKAAEMRGTEIFFPTGKGCQADSQEEVEWGRAQLSPTALAFSTLGIGGDSRTSVKDQDKMNSKSPWVSEMKQEIKIKGKHPQESGKDRRKEDSRGTDRCVPPLPRAVLSALLQQLLPKQGGRQVSLLASYHRPKQ